MICDLTPLIPLSFKGEGGIDKVQKLKFFADWSSPAWTRVLFIVGLILAVFFTVRLYGYR